LPGVGPRVVDNPDELRYELRLDDRLAGQIRYTIREDGTVVLVHTDVDPSLEGQGLGNVLVQGALDDLRERGADYVPLCPFVRTYLQRHPQD
jgi:predicted GNAT family acetyltransferase